MGIREWLNQNRGVTFGVIATVVLVAVASVVVQVMASRKTFPSKLPSAYFTVDDGKTFFEAGSENVAPFEYQGKQALSAHVFQCKGQRFVGYLERFTAEAHKTILAGKATPQTMISGREVKRPGDNNWVKTIDPANELKVTDVKCPDGSPAEPVEP